LGSVSLGKVPKLVTEKFLLEPFITFSPSETAFRMTKAILSQRSFRNSNGLGFILRTHSETVQMKMSALVAIKRIGVIIELQPKDQIIIRSLVQT